MSASSDEEEILASDRDGYEGGDDDDDEDDYEDDAIGKKKKKHTIFRYGFGKHVVQHQFTKAKNKIRRIKSKRAILSSSSSSRNANSKGKIGIIRGDDDNARSGIGCTFCFSLPKVLETPKETPTSDPNDPNFTQSMLKNLIEKNDFYSKECNHHLI